MFAQEAYGLAALAQVGYLRTPQVFALESLTADSSLEDVHRLHLGTNQSNAW